MAAIAGAMSRHASRARASVSAAAQEGPNIGRPAAASQWNRIGNNRPWSKIVAQLATFSGVLQVDGYAAYKSLENDKRTAGKIRLAFCLVHARRKFIAVHKTTNSPFAQEVIQRIAEVYAIEKRIRGASAETRRAFRQAETKPIMQALHARLVAVSDGLSQTSKLREAIDYALNHWAGLTLFLDDGRLEPDTNTVERTIRSIAIGRRNSLFCGDVGGGETWAILSSLLKTAKHPPQWICPLLGVGPDAFNHDNEEFSAIAATAMRHNAISESLISEPRTFEPLFERNLYGEIDARSWCMGFYAAMKPRLLSWSKMLQANSLLFASPFSEHIGDGRRSRATP